MLLHPFWVSQTAPGFARTFPDIVASLAREVPKWPLPELHHLKSQLRDIKSQLALMDRQIHLTRFGPQE